MNVKSHASTRRQPMPISKLGQRRQVVIPKEICDELGLREGDFVEVTREESVVILKPKKLVDVDEVLTPQQKAVIDARIAEGLEDVKKGHVYGPFDSVETMLHSLHGEKPAKRPKRSSRS
jgi:AbrB family looped-hinge helix DNA binding protein